MTTPTQAEIEQARKAFCLARRPRSMGCRRTFLLLERLDVTDER